MRQLIAILNVVAWSGFGAFGYLALTSGVESSGQMVVAAILAALGGGTGMLAYFWLVRHAEETGYARPANRVMQREDDDAEPV